MSYRDGQCIYQIFSSRFTPVKKKKKQLFRRTTGDTFFFPILKIHTTILVKKFKAFCRTYIFHKLSS